MKKKITNPPTEAQLRRHFSISEEFNEVKDILKSLPKGSRSRFICEAIIHYKEVKSDPDWMIKKIETMVEFRSRLINSTSDSPLEDIAIKEIISEVPKSDTPIDIPLKEVEEESFKPPSPVNESIESTESDKQAELKVDNVDRKKDLNPKPPNPMKRKPVGFVRRASDQSSD